MNKYSLTSVSLKIYCDSAKRITEELAYVYTSKLDCIQAHTVIQTGDLHKLFSYLLPICSQTATYDKFTHSRPVAALGLV